MNIGTFYSFLETFRNKIPLVVIRKRLATKFFPRPAIRPNFESLENAPKRRIGSLLPFWISDESVVKRTQLMFYNQNEADRPIALKEFLHVANPSSVFILLLALLSMFFFNLISYTRDLLKKYPEFFTFGMFETVSIPQLELLYIYRSSYKNFLSRSR